MTIADPNSINTLSVVRSEASALIRDEVRTGKQRERLERAVVESINKLGSSIDSVSEASGLTPAEIRRLLDRGPLPESLEALAGIA